MNSSEVRSTDCLFLTFELYVRYRVYLEKIKTSPKNSYIFTSISNSDDLCRSYDTEYNRLSLRYGNNRVPLITTADICMSLKFKRKTLYQRF